MKYSDLKFLLISISVGFFECNSYAASSDATTLSSETIQLNNQPQAGSVTIPQTNLIINLPQNLYLTDPNAPKPTSPPVALPPPATYTNDSTSTGVGAINNLILNSPEGITVTSDPTTTLFNTYLPCPSIPICPNINDLYSSDDLLLQKPVTTIVWSINPVRSTTYTVDNTARWIADLQDRYDTATTPNSRQFCPNQCTVTRQVTPAPPAQPSSYSNAVCPMGYAQVSAYNMQAEIAYDPVGNVALPYPITQETYNAYQSAQPPLRCAAATIAANSETYCAVSYSGYIGSTYWASMVDLTSSYKKNVHPIGVDYYGSGPLGPGMVRNKGIGSRTPDCKANYLPYDCSSGSLTGCSLSCSNNDTMSFACGNRSGATFQGFFYFDTYYTVCYSNPGLYYTKNVEPASLVCARIKPIWKKQSPPSSTTPTGLSTQGGFITPTGLSISVSGVVGTSIPVSGSTSGTLSIGTYTPYSSTPIVVTGTVGGAPTTSSFTPVNSPSPPPPPPPPPPNLGNYFYLGPP